ncbi:Uncharacterized protein PCOAH_00004530 [Plasmodium coatneyi]|uniref:Uncharacterized protein n=1 Tax=Plasmodium coatneyi TaxID=208452 RepID=A0A1B1DUA6_9APIC|nr:Uncharacterized protein PCOAH_00004530 [Plasmodium coatneyi]ANQ06229.1 Uncharacterized protein PCOAH_00004530 [Plasmodium coatneyi]
MDIYLVTGNKNKRLEFQRHMDGELEVQFVDIDLTEIQSNDIVKINEHKAKRAHEILISDALGESQPKRKLVITDDTGLYMDCLGSFPGPYIKWMQKSLGSQGIVDVVTKLQNNKCHAICVYSVSDGKQVHSFQGVTQGRIAGPRGSTDFGWDNIFSPENCSRTFSEMSFDEKKESSPRFKAFVQLKAFLLEELTKQSALSVYLSRNCRQSTCRPSRGSCTPLHGSHREGRELFLYTSTIKRNVMFLTEDQDPEELKKEANEKWAKGEAEEANALWRQALKECIKYSMRGFPTKKNRDMQLSLRLNLSLYHFKKGEYHECINQCDIILEGVPDLDGVLTKYEVDVTEAKPATLPTDTEEDALAKTEDQDTCFLRRDTLVKLFLRRAYSYLMLQEFDKCRENLRLVKRIDKGNAELVNLERKEQVERVHYEKMQRQLYRRMCNASGALHESKEKG